MRTPLAVVILILLPAASASWSTWGSTEPDTSYDVDGGWMWDRPDVSANGGRLYFNVVAEVAGTGQNPNALGLGTDLRAPAASYTAFFGVWKDCNHDGYVGSARGGLLEYKAAESATPVDASICPSDYPRGNNLVFNDNGGGWITELLVVGPATDTRSPGNASYAIPTLVNDTEAQVWGDYGAPGSAPGVVCPLAPLPRGTTASTGRVLDYQDCYAQDGAVGPDVHAPASLYGDPGASSEPGLLRRDAAHPDPSFSTFDCSKPKGGADVRDPTGVLRGGVPLTDPTPKALLTGRQSIGEGILVLEVFPGTSDGGPGTRVFRFTDDDGTVVAAPALAPSVNDPRASAIDGLAGAERATVESCDPSKNGSDLVAPGQLVDQVPSLEGDVRGSGPSKTQNDVVFDLTQLSSSFQEGGEVQNGRTGMPFLGDVLGHNMPQDGGLAPARNVGGAGPGWHSLGASPLSPKSVSRADLAPLSPLYVTFYAHAGLGVRQTFGISTPGPSGVYGFESCDNGAALQPGWDCDASRWWGSGVARPHDPYSHRELGAVVGDSFEARDVDCATLLAPC